MEDSGRNSRIVRFGAYEIDREACELRRAGQVVPLQIQPFRVLDLLVERAGQVVARTELRERIWPATVYVDFDHGLNNAMSRLRHALQDSAEEPRFIETLPRIGYRFVHALEQPRVQSTSASASARRPRLEGRRIAVAAAAVLVLGAVSGGMAYWVRGSNAAGAQGGRPTASTEAYDAYLRGIELFEQRNKESLVLSIEHLERATSLDPGFAAAYAALASDYAAAGGNSVARFMSPGEALGPALTAAERALQLDANLAPAHVALARVLSGLQPWSAATDLAIEQSYRRALELDPLASGAHHYFGIFLSTRGRSDEAIPHFRRALELDPLSPSINSRLGTELIALGNLDEGLQYLRKTVELHPWQFNARIRLGWGYVALGDLAAAEREFAAAERISPNSAASLAGLAIVAARTGDAEGARTLLATVQSLGEVNDDPFYVALVYVGLQDRENAIEWLGKAARERGALQTPGPFGISAPFYDWLRDDARFAAIEREVLATMKLGRSVESAL